MLTIRSSSSNRTLRISGERSDYLQVELLGFRIFAASSVWIETGDAASLVNFFIALGEQQRPWQGQRTWASLEGDFNLSVTCSSLGGITFQVELRDLQGAPEEWQVIAGIEFELGQLARLAEDAVTLLDDK